MKIRDYNSIKWSDNFCLDSTSSSGLSRLNSSVTTGYKCYQRNGKPSGWRVKLNGTEFMVHRIIWCLMYGSLDIKLVIDHLNGDPFDNSNKNLSMKSFRANSQNKAKRKSNVSGKTGVYKSTIYRNNIPFYFWTAQWNNEFCEMKRKSFSCFKYGEDTAFNLATKTRDFEIEKLNNSGLNYTPRHCGLTPVTSPVPSSVQPT